MDGHVKSSHDSCRLTLPISRLASNACLRHGATATMLDLHTSSVQHSPRSAPAPRLWLLSGVRETRHPRQSSQYTKREELCQCYHQQLPRTYSTSCVFCSPGTERPSSALSCSAPGRGGR